MRYFYIVLCILALVALIGHALLQGTNMPFLHGASQVQTEVARGAKTAVQALETEVPITFEINGRSISVSGEAESDEQREQILAAVRSTPLVGRIRDEITVLPVASPYRFRAEKSTDGAISLRGHVPNRASEERLVEAARVAGSSAPPTVELELASGMPEGDWIGMAEAALAALSHLDTGIAEISDTDGKLTGAARDGPSWRASLAAIDGLEMGTWQKDVAGGPPEGGYIFTALKAPDGMLLIEGYAPDAQTRDVMLQAARDVAVNEVNESLEIASEMPEGWPERVRQGLLALGATASGILTVTPEETTLSGEVETEADMAVLSAFIGEDWPTPEILVLDPTPTPDVTILLATDGSLSASGLLPEGLTPEGLTDVLPDTDIAGLSEDERGRAEDWRPALNGLSIVLPRFSAARARIYGKKLELSGNLKRGFSADGSGASLRTELSDDWALALNIAESAPLAEVMLSMRENELVLSGVLPFGLDPDAALGILGDSAGGEGLAGGGDGDAEAWRTTLAGLAKTLPLLRSATGKIGSQTVEIEGELAPGYPASAGCIRLPPVAPAR